MLHHSRSFGVLLLGLLALVIPALPSANFDIIPVTKDVYAVIAKPDITSNGAFIVNQDDVVVVDTQLRPSWAFEVIGEIKKITNKPVRYVINTHWHRDRVQGNQAYIEAFGPSVTIIQQDHTREDQIRNQPVEIKTSTPEEIAQLESLLAAGNDQKGAPLTADSRARLQHLLDLQRAYLAEIPHIRLTPGTLTFDHSLVLHESGRDICLYYFGYAHTRGDIVVYLPAEKVVITGSVLETGIPHIPLAVRDNAYPVEWSSVLQSILKLDWNYAIPGNGGVEQGKETKEKISQVVDYLNDVVAGVKKAISSGMTEEQAVKSIDLSKYAQMPGYKDGNSAVIQRTYLEVSGKLPD